VSVLDRKLLRDILRLWPQVLAIAFVMASGVATLVLGVGTYASLNETRNAYYERNRFADIFAQVTRAPRALAEEIAGIPGIQAVEPRIEKIALLSIPGMEAPASGLFVSLPDLAEQRLNLLTIRQGREPQPGADGEVVISEPFARAHGFGPGSSFEAILNGRKRSLLVVGVALSPEFIYAVGPWDLMPDDRRFGIIWMRERAWAAAYDLEGAFSSLHLKLGPGASQANVIERIDAMLARHGGRGAYGRKDQTSHAFLDAELLQLRAMSRITPPIFLIAAALLVNMTLARLIALERQQIGLAVRVLLEAMRLPPAVAMSPPEPPAYHRMFSGFRFAVRLPGSLRMVLRHLLRWPLRTASAIIGIALSTAILTGTLWVFGASEFMIDATFQRSERQDATISFAEEQPRRSLQDVARLPAILAAEPYRIVPVELRHGPLHRRVALAGKPPDAQLSRVLDQEFRVAALDGPGIALSDALAGILRARPGDVVEVELLERDRRVVLVPVTTVIQGYLGLTAFMNLDALNRIMREPDLISGVHVRYDAAGQSELFERLKHLPKASFIALQRVSLRQFRDTLAQNLLTMVTIYVSLAATIAFGVVYNVARITLSEQGHEMASLRVLGFTRGEVSGLLIGEIAIIVLVAQPLGWAIGHGFAAGMALGFSSELYRVPLVVGREAYGFASLVVIAAALLSALLVRRRIDRLDLVAVLKTRE